MKFPLPLLPLLALVTGRRLSADFVIMEALVLVPAVGALVALGDDLLSSGALGRGRSGLGCRVGPDRRLRCRTATPERLTDQACSDRYGLP